MGYFILAVGIFGLAIGITHGCSYFVMSGSWMGETPMRLLFSYAVFAALIVIGIKTIHWHP
jgi:hypothetical protein